MVGASQHGITGHETTSTLVYGFKSLCTALNAHTCQHPDPLPECPIGTHSDDLNATRQAGSYKLWVTHVLVINHDLLERCQRPAVSLAHLVGVELDALGGAERSELSRGRAYEENLEL